MFLLQLANAPVTGPKDATAVKIEQAMPPIALERFSTPNLAIEKLQQEVRKNPDLLFSLAKYDAQKQQYYVELYINPKVKPAGEEAVAEQPRQQADIYDMSGSNGKAIKDGTMRQYIEKATFPEEQRVFGFYGLKGTKIDVDKLGQGGISVVSWQDNLSIDKLTKGGKTVLAYDEALGALTVLLPKGATDAKGTAIGVYDSLVDMKKANGTLNIGPTSTDDYGAKISGVVGKNTTINIFHGKNGCDDSPDRNMERAPNQASLDAIRNNMDAKNLSVNFTIVDAGKGGLSANFQKFFEGLGLDKKDLTTYSSYSEVPLEKPKAVKQEIQFSGADYSVGAGTTLHKRLYLAIPEFPVTAADMKQTPELEQVRKFKMEKLNLSIGGSSGSSTFSGGCFDQKMTSSTPGTPGADFFIPYPTFQKIWQRTGENLLVALAKADQSQPVSKGYDYSVSLGQEGQETLNVSKFKQTVIPGYNEGFNDSNTVRFASQKIWASIEKMKPGETKTITADYVRAGEASAANSFTIVLTRQQDKDGQVQGSASVSISDAKGRDISPASFNVDVSGSHSDQINAASPASAGPGVKLVQENHGGKLSNYVLFTKQYLESSSIDGKAGIAVNGYVLGLPKEGVQKGSLEIYSLKAGVEFVKLDGRNASQYLEQHPDKLLLSFSDSRNANTFAGNAPPDFIVPVASNGQAEVNLMPGSESVSESNLKAVSTYILNSKQVDRMSDDAIRKSLGGRWPPQLVNDVLKEVNGKL